MLILCPACGNSNSDSGAAEEGAPAAPDAEAALADDAAFADTLPALPPRLELKNGRGSIAVLEQFDQLKSLLQQNNDTTYVVNFWATWCKPCIEELPYFEKLHSQFAGQKLRVVLVSLDFRADLEQKLLPFVEEQKLSSEVQVLLDESYNDWIDQVDPSWGGAIPITLVYKGNKREFIGEQLSGYDQLAQAIQSVR